MTLPHLVLYSKPGCHLCAGLREKLTAIAPGWFHLEERDITTNADWWERYQYEIPVLALVNGDREVRLPRLSPRLSAAQCQAYLQQWFTRLPTA
ncbi:MAG: glutaredoxin family protein [Gloeomargarita sp. SKYG116]|nr:glutaredoxin family protein [Gloeomargarita sp. SKYG116]MDW8400219.1 glutaredoxin family protein [Gloeomargarita sp. SKYGB_i_bin116]